jgi:L-aspartate oxidase
MLDIIARGNECKGIIIRDSERNIKELYSDYVVLACGGIGGLFESSTNYPHLTGDAVAVALNHGVEVQDLDYVQIHPTTLYSEKKGRRFLISESVRGEGAYLYNANMERFVDELLPRDVLSEKIKEQMTKEGSKYVWLSIAHLDSEEIINRFPNIYRRCLEEGYDITKEPIPVTPAQHYFMGGIKVDINSKTSMEHLYAAGETSCNGVHGANRLASNSLLETLVFSKRCAKHIMANYEKNNFNNIVGVLEPKVYERYQNAKELEKEYKTIVIDNIEEFGVKREKENK